MVGKKGFIMLTNVFFVTLFVVCAQCLFLLPIVHYSISDNDSKNDIQDVQYTLDKVTITLKGLLPDFFP